MGAFIVSGTQKTAHSFLGKPSVSLLYYWKLHWTLESRWSTIPEGVTAIVMMVMVAMVAMVMVTMMVVVMFSGTVVLTVEVVVY